LFCAFWEHAHNPLARSLSRTSLLCHTRKIRSIRHGRALSPLLILQSSLHLFLPFSLILARSPDTPTYLVAPRLGRGRLPSRDARAHEWRTSPRGLSNETRAPLVWCKGGIPGVNTAPLRVGLVIRVQRTLGAFAGVVEAGSGEGDSDAPRADSNCDQKLHQAALAVARKCSRSVEAEPALRPARSGERTREEQPRVSLI